MTDKEYIENLYKKYWECMINKDADGLRSILGDGYELRHMTGLRQSRESFLSSLLSGELNYYSANHDEIIINISGCTATLIGRSVVLAAVYGGGKHSWKLQGDFTLEKVNNKWGFTSSVALTY